MSIHRIKSKLIQERGCVCECCGLGSWLNQQIHLEVHHIDGDNTNNNFENLQLLCPNCHSYTNNYCKRKPKIEISDEELVNALQQNQSIRQALLSLKLSDAGTNYERARQLANINNIKVKPEKITNTCSCCGAQINIGATMCRSCYYLSRRKVTRPNRQELKDLIRNNSFVSLGKKFGVSDKAIVKWCQGYNLPSKRKDIKAYTDKEWALI